MKLPAYPRTKPSGVEWLGDVPEHWEVDRLKRSSLRVTDGAHISPDLSSSDFPFVSTVDIHGGKIDFDDCLRTSDECYSYLVRTGCRPHQGDLLFSKDGTVGRTALVDVDREFVVASSLVIVSPRPTRLNAGFLDYWLNNSLLQQDILLQISGAALRRISVEKVSRLPVLLPPPAEQRAIAMFLDRETGRVDRLVAKKRELIERLKEKRTSLISHTVTRGLPPAAADAAGLAENPPLKPSGIEWLGDIPRHWDVRRLKDVGTLKGGAGFPHEEQGLEDEELPFYKVGDLKASLDGRVMTKSEHTISKETARKLRAAIIPPESIVYAKIGAALLLNRRRVTFADCCIDNNMTAYLPDGRRIRSEWAFYWLSILDFGEFMNPGAVPSFSEGYQAILPVLLPPLLEQAAIAAYLDEETAKLDALVGKVEEAVERLQEYRTALITAAVTGKIDVREEMAT